MTGRLDTRRALVSGGASGIGLATGRRLADEGSAVVLLDSRHEAVAAAAAEIGVHSVTADVTDAPAVTSAMATATRLLDGPPDVVVNAAGIYRIASLLDLEADEWDTVLAVNLRGAMFVAREAVRALGPRAQGAAIINISSIAGLVANVAEPAGHYAASKAGVLALTRQMAVEWGRLGVRTNAICPGVIATPMLRLTDDPAAAEDYVRRRVPLGRIGVAEEVAAVAAFLASDDAAYVNGATVTVDGGVTAL